MQAGLSCHSILCLKKYRRERRSPQGFANNYIVKRASRQLDMEVLCPRDMEGLLTLGTIKQGHGTEGKHNMGKK